MEGDGTHTGRRDRLRRRFLDEGIDGFSESEILELLLQFTIPRIDTNPIAHRLLDRFGSIAGVLDAPAAELRHTEGVGEVTAAMLHAWPSVYRRYAASREIKARAAVGNADDLCAYACGMYIGRTREAMGMIGLDAHRAVKFRGVLWEGDHNRVHAYVGRICRAALDANVNCVALVHNHPNGSPIFSRADQDMTVAVIRALDVFDICLADHILVLSETEAISMESIGLLESMRLRAGTS